MALCRFPEVYVAFVCFAWFWFWRIASFVTQAGVELMTIPFPRAEVSSVSNHTWRMLSCSLPLLTQTLYLRYFFVTAGSPSFPSFRTVLIVALGIESRPWVCEVSVP